MKPIRLLALGFAAGWLCASHSAHAQFSPIDGDALTVQVSAGARTGSVAIPRTQLVQLSNQLLWQWTSPAPVDVLAGDGTRLGSFEGHIAYDPNFDNIDFGLNFVAGAADAHFMVRSGDLINSFTGGGDLFTAAARLLDQNNNGATLGCLLPAGLFSQVEWNGVVQLGALSGFSAPSGGNVFQSAGRMGLGVPYSGTKVVRADFSLTAGDSLESAVISLTAIPAPGAAGLFLVVGTLLSRGRGRRAR